MTNQVNPPKIPKTLTRQEVAKHLNKSVSTLNRMLANGEFPRGPIVGGRECWLESDVASYINDRIRERDARIVA